MLSQEAMSWWHFYSIPIEMINAAETCRTLFRLLPSKIANTCGSFSFWLTFMKTIPRGRRHLFVGLTSIPLAAGVGFVFGSLSSRIMKNDKN